MRSKTRTGSNCEYRLDIRGKNGNIDRVKILERHDGGKFVQIDGKFTDEHVAHLDLFQKAAAAGQRQRCPLSMPTQLSARLTVRGARKTTCRKRRPLRNRSMMAAIGNNPTEQQARNFLKN
jgi:hypothetical protein